MLLDLVVDTNVLCHAQNPAEERFQAAQELLSALLECATDICVDEGFDLDETKNRSFICSEYLRRLVPGSAGFHFLVFVATHKRVKQLPRRPEPRAKKFVERVIRKKPDRIFLGVACNTLSMTLVSHDLEDFDPAKRVAIRRELGVAVIEASECTPLLT